MTQYTPLRVLVAEDDTVPRILIERFLQQIGVVHMRFCQNGAEALQELINNPHYNVVLTDNQMPEMDGRELIVGIRKNGLIRHVKIAMLSGNIENTESPESDELKTFLYQYRVLPVSKETLNAEEMKRVFAALFGF